MLLAVEMFRPLEHAGEVRPGAHRHRPARLAGGVK